MRTSKVVNEKIKSVDEEGKTVVTGKKLKSTTKYYYAGDSLVYQCTTETVNNTTQKTELYFFYDSYGNLTLIKYYKNGNLIDFPVLTNSQGDVVAIYNTSGTKLISYEYDAWGNATISGSAAIGTLNPIRYRGYYYDSDLKLYYLQSRYYDAEIGRFLNSDSFTDSNAGVLGYNTFIYCANDPVNSYDPSGHSVILSILGKALVGGLFGAAIGAGVNFVGQLKRNGGDFSKIDKKELGIAAAVGGITGALSGGFGAAIAKAAGSIVAKTAATIVTEGVVNAAGGTCEALLNGTERTMSDYVQDFAVGAGTSFVATAIPVLSNHSRFSRSTKSQKRAMLNNKFTNREIKAGVYNTPEYKIFLLEGSDELASCFDVAVKLFEEYQDE